MSPVNPHERLRQEALRLHARYQREVIEQFSVYPWAKGSRLEGTSREHVITSRQFEGDALADTVADWAADESLEVAFVIAPRHDGTMETFGRWAEGLVEPHAAVFYTAVFHPDFKGASSSIQFLRQSPDPTVQLVRRTRLEAIRGQDPPHYRNIFDLDISELEAAKPTRTVAATVIAHNEQMLEREGHAQIQSIIDDIRRDRERTYAALLTSFRGAGEAPS